MFIQPKRTLEKEQKVESTRFLEFVLILANSMWTSTVWFCARGV